MSRDKQFCIKLLKQTNAIKDHSEKAGFSKCSVLYNELKKNGIKNDNIIKDLERFFQEMKTQNKSELYYKGFRDCLEFLKENI